MFEPDLSQYEWGAALSEAAMRGPDDVVRIARRVRSDVEDADADRIALSLAELFDLNLDPPGRLGSIVAAASVFAGPLTLARVGEVLRRDLRGAGWKIERGLEILERSRRPEATVELALCARDAAEFAVLQRAKQSLRGAPATMRQLLDVRYDSVPPAHLDRYLALQLEKAMLEAARFRAGALRGALQTSATAPLRRVVWARYEGRQPVELFVVDPESSALLNADWTAVELDDDATIGVPHPAEIALLARRDWGLWLAENEVVGLFRQVDREYVTADRELPYRRIDRDVPHWDLVRFLYQNGWDRDAESRDFNLNIRGKRLILSTRIASGDLRRLEALALIRPHVDRGGVEDDITFSEGLAAAVALLEEFAPDLI